MKIKKLLCIILSVLMIFPFLTGTIHAQETPTETPISENLPIDRRETESIPSLLPDDLMRAEPGLMTISELEKIDVESLVFPSFISREKAISKGHANRLHVQEKDLSTVIYQNKDGSKTAYLFSTPVKYIDPDGAIRDKHTAIEAYTHSTYSFAMEDNIFQAYFSKTLSDGILVRCGEFDLQMTPVGGTLSSTPTKESENVITYPFAFGENTFLTYTTLLSGVKEDIILAKYTGIHEFQFTLDTDGLTPVQTEEGKWVLMDGDRKLLDFGDILIKDSNGKITYGSLSIQQTDEDRYLMTVSCPVDFLTAEDTFYPVFVDPTVTIEEEQVIYDEWGDFTGIRSAILDIPIYEDADEFSRATAGDETLVLDGTEEGGKSYILYKFPDFYDFGVGFYTGISPYRIGSAKMYLHVEWGNDCTLSVNPMTGTYDLNTYQDNATAVLDQNLINYKSSLYQKTATATYDTTVEFDLTGIFRAWASYNLGEAQNTEAIAPQYGILLSASDDASITSTEATTHPVYVEMDYSYTGGEYYIYNLTTPTFISANSTATSVSPASFQKNATRWWIIDYAGSNQYYLRSAADPDQVLYNSGASLYIGSFALHTDAKWYVPIAETGGVHIHNGTYAICLTGSGSTLGLGLTTQYNYGNTKYEASRWGIWNRRDYKDIDPYGITLSDDWLRPGESKYFNISTSPSDAFFTNEACFSWTIANTSIITSSANDPSRLTGITAGKTTLTLRNLYTGYTQSFTIACGALREGTYGIENKGSHKFIDIVNDSMANGAGIEQRAQQTHSSQRWQLTQFSDGSYCIKSVLSKNCLAVNNGAYSSGAPIVQVTSSGTACWHITQTASGAYRITSITYPQLALSAPSGQTGDGVLLCQLTYTQDSNYYDEWYINNQGPNHDIVDGAYYTFCKANSSYVLGIANQGTADGTDVVQQPKDPKAKWQTFQFEYVGDGDYKIRDVNSGKLVSIYANSSATGANVNLWYDNNSSGQLFKIRTNTNGTFTFLPKSAGYTKAIGIPNTSSQNGASFKLVIDNGTHDSNFNLEADKLIFRLSVSQSQDKIKEDGKPKFSTGHAWIELKNTTTLPQTVGFYTIEQNEEISIGRFGGASGKYGFDGIWYNLESHLYYNQERFQVSYHIEVIITVEDLKEISEYTKNHNVGYNLMNNNCVTYALNIWLLLENETLTSDEANSILRNLADLPEKLEQKMMDKINNNIAGVYSRSSFFEKEEYGYYSDEDFQNCPQIGGDPT